MKRILYCICISCLLLSCKNAKHELEANVTSSTTRNISTELLSELDWLNDPSSFEVRDSSLSVTVTKGTDFFNNPEDSSIIATAPFLYKRMNGDFVAKVLVQPDFSAQWNAVSLMVHIDSLHWIKFAFENSDATGPSIVTVVTNRTSDDANGVVLNEENQIWLAMVRKKNIYSMHWSIDGESYKMARLTSMPQIEDVSIGIEFQSPEGNKATHFLHSFEIEERTVDNLRSIQSGF